MSISLFVFFISLYKIGEKERVRSDIFFSLILVCIGVIFFGRLLYIVAEWRDHKFLITQFTNGQSTFLELISGFIVMKNYNLAFMGGVFGFFVSVYIQLKRHTAHFRDIIDIIMPSFFYAGIFGYFGAFLGEQIYGIQSQFLGILHPVGSTIPYSGGIFPLALVYMGLCIVGSICWYALRQKVEVRGGA
jgi:prolipoprotein diacylglyceryltransferase